MLIFNSILEPISLPNLFAFFVSYLVRQLLINISETIAGDRIGLGFWLNVSFAVNNKWAFRSISDIAIDLSTWKDRYFQRCVSVFTIPTTSGRCAHVWYNTLCLATGFQSTAVPPTQRAKYGIVTEYRCIAMQNSTHSIWITALQRCLLHAILHKCSEMLNTNIRS